MDIFYIVVLSVAIIFLILILTVVGIMMKQHNRIDVYPPFQSKCPDYWTVNGDGTCTAPSSAIGSNSVNALASSYKYTPEDDPTLRPKVIVNSASGAGLSKTFDFSVNSLCDSKRWATRNRIEWDGVSNSIAKC
jgi:hypothetical protein